ncbi:cellulase family glycosylhydrolase [Exilibacterium tricleocarpae]|uniref:Cellulase family glycosylhydrolase n=1 Tax=Exilibacterium tricleocarpae TaxID=2591008 RepID=A0A545SRS7_9GAMM|nr:cellulase family glycosylhydrolase [Exilibacterium tricleocarpae]TQV67669.1 cellulase family glycosylhydrolase [Exilibacterium tricleocarpae]
MNKLLATGFAASIALQAIPAAAVVCNGLDTWNNSTVYLGGHQVQHNNNAYRANWWTRNHNPETHSNPHQEWSLLGACDGGGSSNQAPSANANGPYTGQVGAAIAFSSASSNDADGTIAGYSWNFGDGATSSAANPSHSYGNAGTYTVTLTVTDNDGASATASTAATTTGDGGSSGGNCAGLPTYVAGTSYTSGQRVANFVDASGDTVEFICNIAGWCSSSAAWAYEPGNGRHWEDAWREVGRCDGGGGSNKAPLANANGPYSGTAGTAVTFSSAGSTDPDGTITGYRWSFGDGSTSSAANPSHSYTNDGTYTVTLTVTDNDGAATTDSTIATISDAGGGSTPVAINGQLRVCGNKLCNQFGQPIQLRGMSTHGLQWYGWGNCVTESSLDALAYDWGADILRISLYVQEGGYETDPQGFTAQVSTIIDAATARGMYALVDWHQLTPGDPNANLDNARRFFTDITQAHNGNNNVIYDIANEPNNVSWADIKRYAEQIIPVIRRYDPDAVVLVGTHAWASLGVSEGRSARDIVDNPINADNLMYTFHFYAASHGAVHRNELAWAADRLPIFVSEWGSQTYTGDGANDFASAQAYIDLMAQKKISWTSWNYSDDFRSGAVFRPGTCASNGPWSGGNLKSAGQWVRDKIQNPPDNFPTR